MSQVRDLCTQIAEHLTRLTMGTERNLLPGLSERKIRALTANLPFALPRPVIELYMWSAGLKPGAGVGTDFFPGYGMDALSEMVEMYRNLSTESEYPRFRVGDRQWFPLFRSGGTDFYGVCCEATPAADGEIVDDDNVGNHRDGIIFPPVAYLGLEAMLRTLLRCYETGVFYTDEQGRLEVGVTTYFTKGRRKGQIQNVDITRFRDVGRLFNPGLAYWE